MNSPITIPKNVTGGADLVVITKKAYDELQQHLLEVQDALQKIQRGEQEYQSGRTKATRS